MYRKLLLLIFMLGCKQAAPKVVDAGPGNKGRDQTKLPSQSKRPEPDYTPDPRETEEEPSPTPLESDTPPTENWNTNGSGGVKGRSFNGRGPNGEQYIVFAPTNNGPQQRSHGLLVLLHGSSASSYDRFVGQMGRLAENSNLIPISVLAPNRSGWNEGNQFQNATYLDNLIQNTIYKSYNIDTRNIIFSGQSSGAGFLASHFIVGFGYKYQGGAFMLCGGSRPVESIQKLSQDYLQKFKLHFEITTNDGIWERSFFPAIQDYKAAGFTLTSNSNKPGGHCNFDQAQIIQQYIRNMLTQ